MDKNLFRSLEWRNTEYGIWISYSPISGKQNGRIQISFEQEKYWPIWNCALPGYDTLEEAKQAAENEHKQYLFQFIDMDFYMKYCIKGLL